MSNSIRTGFLFLPLVFAACGTSAPTTNASASAEPVERARVQAYLDARYTARDVRGSFHTPQGQDIDCVDFFAERGVRALATEGHALTSIPTPPPVPEAIQKRIAARGASPADDIMFHGQPDAFGKPESCPAGSVPEVRVTASDIARHGGLDAYLQYMGHKAGPPRPARPEGTVAPGIPTCASLQQNESPDFAHVVGTLAMDQPGVEYALTTMAVYGPRVPTSEWVGNQLDLGGDHSLSQIWVYSDGNTNTSGTNACTSNCVQSVEVGWSVDPHNDSGNADVPHIFIFSTNNGYNTGCYNNNGNDGTCGPTWVPYPNVAASFAPDAVVSFNPPANTGGQDPQAGPIDMGVVVYQSTSGYEIGVELGSQFAWIGYYQASAYTQSMDTVQVGGEAADLTNAFVGTGLQMGSGYPAADGFGWSAYHYGFMAQWTGGASVSTAQYCATRPQDYGLSTVGGQGNWGSSYFYYGGTPPATSCVATTCAAQGAVCGSISDGCGNTLECGICRIAGQTCESNRCALHCTGRICPQ